MNDVLVTIEHVRKARLCARGARTWFTKHDLDYMKFVQHGYPASVIEATGDAFGARVVAIARADAAGDAE
jgi:hypothetical protein